MAPSNDLSFVPAILAARKLRILFSACLLGEQTTWDGKGFDVELLKRIAGSPKVEVLKFCPENFSFGTPREFSSIHGGNGADVLDGRAKVMTLTGVDWSEGAVAGANAMAGHAQQGGADLGILLDSSPACGPRVVYLGDPAEKKYQRGQGVAAAALMRAGIPLIAQRDYASLHALLHMLDESFVPDPAAYDHVDSAWYREYFGTRGGSGA